MKTLLPKQASEAESQARVNRIIRENNLLSPNRRSSKASKREHDGTIITDSPNLMWVTDGNVGYRWKKVLD